MKKAIRNGYPDFALQHGAHMQFAQASGEEWQNALLNQASEELKEMFTEATPERFSEIMDLLEAFSQAQGWSWNKIEQERINNEETYGGFSNRLVVDENEVKPVVDEKSSSILHRKNYNYPHTHSKIVEPKIKDQRQTPEIAAENKNLPEIRQASVLAQRSVEK